MTIHPLKTRINYADRNFMKNMFSLINIKKYILWLVLSCLKKELNVIISVKLYIHME